MDFRRMSLRLRNAYRGEIVNLYFTEIISMSPSERDEIRKLRSSPVCGDMEYVDENGSVTIVRLRKVAGAPLGERVIGYLKRRGEDERYLVFSRYAPLVLNSGNVHSRTTELLPIKGDPNEFTPENVDFDNSLVITSLDEERILVISSQDQTFVLAADLMLGVYAHTQEKSAPAACYSERPKYQDQPKECLIVRTNTYSNGLEAIEQYLPFLGIWTWNGMPYKVKPHAS
jgi:hypothetical protein